MLYPTFNLLLIHHVYFHNSVSHRTIHRLSPCLSNLHHHRIINLRSRHPLIVRRVCLFSFRLILVFVVIEVLIAFVVRFLLTYSIQLLLLPSLL